MSCRIKLGHVGKLSRGGLFPTTRKLSSGLACQGNTGVRPQDLSMAPFAEGFARPQVSLELIGLGLGDRPMQFWQGLLVPYKGVVST